MWQQEPLGYTVLSLPLHVYGGVCVCVYQISTALYVLFLRHVVMGTSLWESTQCQTFSHHLDLTDESGESLAINSQWTSDVTSAPTSRMENGRKTFGSTGTAD